MILLAFCLPAYGGSSCTPPGNRARRFPALKCLSTNARSMGNTQEQLEICVQSQGHDLIAVTGHLIRKRKSMRPCTDSWREPHDHRPWFSRGTSATLTSAGKTTQRGTHSLGGSCRALMITYGCRCWRSQQGKWQCCGAFGADDWNLNIYFNCTDSNASRERCGVPFSCCTKDPAEDVINTQCGYDARQKPEVDQQIVIYTKGCVPQFEKWLQDNLTIVAGIFIGIALLQIFGICLAQNLVSDIEAVRASW
ncbi:tetraspanin-5 isoform X2 [Falco cherrug]|uniref:tetraspanin-5 isoform X2 n=1 Tax=Falco cherrug TaxID=345164 RepID=UPI0006B82DB2|nr:tetraspanin-5 isoform X2 [Falco cherrug]